MKAIIGQPPNLPWWKIQNMSYAEIKEFNDEYLREVEMDEYIISDLKIKVWNEAIEAAVIVAEREGKVFVAQEIRKLKK